MTWIILLWIFQGYSLFSYQCSLLFLATLIYYHIQKCLSTTFLFFFFNSSELMCCRFWQLWYFIKSSVVCQQLFQKKFEHKNVNIKFDIFSCFYRFAILHNTQPVSLYIFTFRQRNSKAATPASLSRPLFSFLCKLFYLFLE